jgi:hypothetical protein
VTARRWRILCLASLGTMIGVSAVGGILSVRLGEPPLAVRIACLAAIGLAFATFVASIPPVIVRAFLAGHERLGNRDHPLVGFLLRHERRVVWAIWLVWALGAAIALPVAVRDVMSGP